MVAETTARAAQPGLLRVVLARLNVRLARRLILAGEWLAPEAAFSDFPPEPGYE